MRVLLACQTATNKGDRAIAEYIISQLLSQGHEVVLSATRPDLWETAKDQNVEVIPMGYKSIYRNMQSRVLKKILRIISRLVCDKLLFANLISPKGNHRLCNRVSREFIQQVKAADLVIVTGGHHITSIREKNALFQFTYDIGLISLYAKRYALWAQTIGPLEFTAKRAKNFFEKVLKNADRVFIRDENSRDCVKKLYGDLQNITKTCDTVFGFGNQEFPAVSQREKKVGIAIFDGLKKAFSTYETIAAMLDSYAEKGYEIEFFRMEYNDYELSNIHKVVNFMKQKAKITIHPFMTTTEAHLKEVASCRYFIGYKTHSVIMALTTATPLIAIAYHEKTNDFMRDYGLEDYAIPDEELNIEKAEKCMQLLEENAEAIHAKQKEVSRAIAEVLQKDLFEMVRL